MAWNRNRKAVIRIAVLLSLLPFTAAQAEAEVAQDLLLILDASGSMWGQIEGENKIVIAREVLTQLAGKLPEGIEVGLLAYGHRREGDCDDVELVVPMGPLDRAALNERIVSINPKGKTPITRSIERALGVVTKRDRPTTIILVSDGLETCDGDPCATVRRAREAGIPIVLHVVGFDIAEADVSQLECAAQAGNGLYFDARSAEELSGALDEAVETPTEIPPGRLSVKTVADGALVDSTVSVFPAGERDKDVAHGRTYTSAETNPRVFALPGGSYDVEVRAIGFKGDVRKTFEAVEVGGAEGDPVVERIADFGTGRISIKVTRNGELSDATVRILEAGTTRQVAAGRSYTDPKHNPSIHRVTPGVYDVEIGSVEMKNTPKQRFEALRVEPGGLVEREHDFVSGVLKIGVRRGEEPVDATIQVRQVDSGKQVAGGRSYTDPKHNPKSFVIPPGRYRVDVKAVRLEGKPEETIEVEVEAGTTTERRVDL